MDYTALVAYVISVVSLGLSIYTLYELNCTREKPAQKPKVTTKPVTKKSSTKQYPPSEWK
jgi:hypothetical protein